MLEKILSSGFFYFLLFGDLFLSDYVLENFVPVDLVLRDFLLLVVWGYCPREFWTFGFWGEFVLWDYVQWDYVLGDFVQGDFVPGDFVLGDFVLGDFLSWGFV